MGRVAESGSKHLDQERGVDDRPGGLGRYDMPI